MGYRDYLIKRGLSTIPMFIGLSVLIFTLARVIPGGQPGSPSAPVRPTRPSSGSASRWG